MKQIESVNNTRVKRNTEKNLKPGDKGYKEPIQVILVGDFFQLPPVLKKEDKDILENHKYHKDIGAGFAFTSEYWNKLGIKKPDKVIFLNADFEAVQNMLKLRGDNGGVENDIYEADMTFMKNVHDNAVSVAEYLNWDIIECSKDGKMLSIDEIHDKIYDVFKSN